MKILLTGGAGYVGSHICVELLLGGFEVVVVDNYSNSKPDVQERICQVVKGQWKENNQSHKDENVYQQSLPLTFYFGDCRDGYFLNDVFREHEIDAVIHLAGLKAVGESLEKPLDYYDNNIGSILVLLQVMKDNNVKNLIFSSSATVYSSDNKLPLTEYAKTGNCTNPYGWTKYMIEQILMDVAKSDAEWNIALLRYFNPVGAHPSGLIGEDPNGIPSNLLPYICCVAKNNCDEKVFLNTGCKEKNVFDKLKIFGKDYDTLDGTGVRDYIHVVDLAQGHVAAISYLYRHKGLDIFNLGTGRGYSVMEMVRTFQQINGVNVPYEFTSRRNGDIASVYANPAKAKKELLWEAKLDLTNMVRDAWNFVVSQKINRTVQNI